MKFHVLLIHQKRPFCMLFSVLPMGVVTAAA